MDEESKLNIYKISRKMFLPSYSKVTTEKNEQNLYGSPLPC